MTRLSVVAILVIAGWSGRQQEPQVTPIEALNRAEAQWQQRKPSEYEFGIELRCFCVGLVQKPVSFRVRGADVRPLQDMGPDAKFTYGYYDSIEKLFAAIRRSLTRGQYKVVIEYDPGLGYPIKADLDPKQTTVDDELFFRVSSFRKIENGRSLPNTPLQPTSGGQVGVE